MPVVISSVYIGVGGDVTELSHISISMHALH